MTRTIIIRTLTMKNPDAWERLDDPDYRAITEDGVNNSITDLMDQMAYNDAHALGFISGRPPRFAIKDHMDDVPGADSLDLDELQEDLKSLGIVPNRRNYEYIYRPDHGLLKEITFMVDTFGSFGTYSVTMIVMDKVYR
jgi:hypothetical protein